MAEGARRNGKFKAISTAPTFNKTPVGSATPPVPYPVSEDLSSSVGTVSHVHFNGDPAYVLSQSTQPGCKGDAAGTAKGVKSGTVSGEVKPVKGASSVRANKRPVIRDGDPCTLNGGNCPGIYQTQPAGSGKSLDNPIPSVVQPQTAQERSFWSQASPWVHGALGAASFVPGLSIVTGAADAAIYAAEGEMVEAGLAAASMIPGGKIATTAGKLGKTALKAARGARAAEEAAQAARAAKAAEEANAARRAAQEAERAAGAASAEQRAAGSARAAKAGKDNTKVNGKRRPQRRCELVPFDELECPPGQHRHHVVPDWMLRLGKRGGPEQIPDMPSIGQGPAICLEGGPGESHSTAHKHTDKVAERVGRSGRSTGTPGTVKLGQAKKIASRAIEKATKGGCSRAEIQQQLDEMFKAHNDAVVRAVKDAKKVLDAIRNAVKRGGDI